ncbi:hypothetical protein Tco_1458780 [Tanacetum coccineum]
MTEQWVRHILSVHMADISKQFSSSACCGPGYNLARQSMVLVIMALDDPYVLINRIMAGILVVVSEQYEGLREVGLGQRNKFPSNNDSNNLEIQLQTINNSVAQPSKVKEYPLLIITWNVMKNKNLEISVGKGWQDKGCLIMAIIMIVETAVGLAEYGMFKSPYAFVVCFNLPRLLIIMSQEQCQQAAYNETLVPSADRVEISTKNMRIEPNVPQRKETFQKIKKSPAYEFGLDDKKFQVDVDVFREILGICPRVPKEDFVPPPSEEELLNFLLELGYKGHQNHLPNMENVEYPELIWEDLAYQIDYGQAKLRRQTMLNEEIMHSEAFQTFIILHLLVPPTKSRDENRDLDCSDNTIRIVEAYKECLSFQDIQISKGRASITPWADESTDSFKTSSEGTGIKPGVPDKMQTQESKVDKGKALDTDLVDTESIRTHSTMQDESSRSGYDTDADDANIRPIYDEEPMAEMQLTTECNIFAIGQQHTEQPEIINEGRVDQYPEQCQVKSPMLDSSPDNQTTDYSKQSLESGNILLKKTVSQFQKDFSRMEAHCIALKLKYQNQALKSGQHG